MQRVNVLLLITELNIGGAEKLVADIAVALDRGRYKITVACLFDPGAFSRSIKKSGIQVIDLDMKNQLDIRVFGRLQRLLVDYETQIVHGHLFHANLVGSIMGRITGVPIIINTRHSVEIGGKKREIVNRFSSLLADRVVAVTDEVRFTEVVRAHLPQDKVIMISNRIDTSRYLSSNSRRRKQLLERFEINEDDLIIGCIGRLEIAKGHKYLIEAVNSNPDWFSNLKILIVGDGTIRRELVEFSQSSGLAEQFIFTGLQQDIPEILSQISIYIQPSLWEGLPLAVLEAMAAGKPVIASAVGGVPELVVDGETGILVPPRDPDALAKAINTLLSDSDLARRMGEAGRKRAIEHFDISITIKETEALYDRLIKQKLGLVYEKGAGWIKIQ